MIRINKLIYNYKFVNCSKFKNTFYSNIQTCYFTTKTTDIDNGVTKEIDYFLDTSLSNHSFHLESFGVFRENEIDDVKVLVNNFTAPALALALRERENTLQLAAMLAESGKYKELNDVLHPFLKSSVKKRRNKRHEFDTSKDFTRKELVILQRYLHRMPRHVAPGVEKRASVVIPLCNVSGVASILFERRSGKVRTYKNQVCFPGGMLDEGVDATIIQTSLRELEEELGIPQEKTEVLGILRCNWNEVASMTGYCELKYSYDNLTTVLPTNLGIAVTPVVGFIGEYTELSLTPNKDEVESLFTVKLSDLLDDKKWIIREYSAPVFTGGPHVIWGLTGYLLYRFLQDVVIKCNRTHTSEI